MDNDRLSEDFGEVMALVDEQMRDLAVMQEKRKALMATATAARGTVEVSVDAHKVVTAVEVDDAYLEEFEFDDLGGFVVAAAQAAAREVDRQGAALLAPLSERREAISGMSGAVEVPEFGDILSRLRSFTGGPVADQGSGDVHEDLEDASSYPVVVREVGDV